MMVIDNKYEIGDIVFLITDVDRKPRIVSSIEVFMNGELMYRLMQGTQYSSHYSFEITEERNYIPL